MAIFGLGRNISFLKKIRIFCHENTHILSCTCLNYKLKILKKRCQEKWENAYLTLKNTRASRALRRALDTGQYMLASLALRRCAPSANLGKKLLGPPPDQILDPHLTFRRENNAYQFILMTALSLISFHRAICRVQLIINVKSLITGTVSQQC